MTPLPGQSWPPRQPYLYPPQQPPASYPTHNMWTPPPLPVVPVKQRNGAAIAAATVAAVGIVWAWLGIALFVDICGVTAVVLGVLGNRRALKGAPLGKLALLGALIGILELVASFA